MASENEIREIEDMLRERRKKLLVEALDKLEAARDPTSSARADHLIEDGDVALADLLSHTSLAESQRDLQEIQNIEATLQRIAGGNYGTCAQCGVEIETARLKAQPTAVRCTLCQSEYERTHAGTSTPTL